MKNKLDVSKALIVIFFLLILVAFTSMMFDFPAGLALLLGLVLVKESLPTSVSALRVQARFLVSGAVLVVLVLVALIGFAKTLTGFLILAEEVVARSVLPTASFYCVFVGVLVYLAIRSVGHVSDRLFVVISLSIAVGVRAAYSIAVHVEQVSDFLMMANHAEVVSTAGITGATKFGPVIPILVERVLFYLVPFHYLVPSPDWVIPVANMVFSGASIYLLYLLSRRLFADSAVARVATVIACFVPESIILTNIASHDVPGAFWVLANIYVVVRIVQDRGSRRGQLLLAAILGVTLVFAELQRTVGAFLILFDVLAVGIACVPSNMRRKNLTTLTFCLLSMVIAVPVVGGVRAKISGDSVEKRTHIAEVIIAQSDPRTDGSYAHWKSNWEGNPPGN